MKRNSHTSLKDFKKIYFGLNTFSILSIYKKLDPFSKLKYKSGDHRKASIYETLNIIIVRSVLMIYALIINTFLTVLFGVIPVSVIIHSSTESTEKNFVLQTVLISVTAALFALFIIVRLIHLNIISVIFTLTWIILMHITAYLIVKKKYRKISFELCQKG